MVHLSEIIDMKHLDMHVKEGNVRIQVHPSGQLRILNYTHRCQFAGAWDETTTKCRGIIIDTDDNVTARPFAKFFNLGEHTLDELPSGRVVVSDKLDGSLGVCFKAPDGKYAIATRGSFMSDRAEHATRLLRERYPDFNPEDGHTYLFEIIYPENRIVVDYEGMDELILIGIVNIETGRSVPLDENPGNWPGPVTHLFPFGTLSEAMLAAPREGKEGMVVHYADEDVRVKLKQDEYVRLHKVITGLNARRVWEALSQTESVEGILDLIPDELFDWVRACELELRQQYEAEYQRVETLYKAAFTEAEKDPLYAENPKKAFALKATRFKDDSGLLFTLNEGRSIREKIWTRVRPSTEDTPFAQAADAE